MIFDFTDLGTGVNRRFKPLNRVWIEGTLHHGEDEIAAFRRVILLYSPGEYNLAGGRFVLAWHRMREPITQPLKMVIRIEDHRPDQVFGSGIWEIYDVAILDDGVPQAVGDFTDLLGREIVFFGRRTRT